MFNILTALGRKTFLCLIVGLSAFAANAQEKSVMKPALATLEDRNGLIFLKFVDGREAVLVAGSKKPIKVSMPMTQVDNTCHPAKSLANCRFVTEASPLNAQFRWSKHPDATKINKMIKTGVRTPGADKLSDIQEVKADTFLFWFNNSKLKVPMVDFKEDRIVCDSLDWLKDARVEDGLSVIESWSSEGMDTNRETQVDENETGSAIFGARMKILNDNVATLVKYDSYYAANLFTPPHLSIQTMNFTYLSKNGKNCQTAFQIDGSKVISIIQSEEFLKIEDSAYAPVKEMPQGSLDFMSFLMYRLTQQQMDVVEAE